MGYQYTSLIDESKDIYLNQGKVLVIGEINDELIEKVSKEMRLIHTKLPKDQKIEIFLNTPGGDVFSGLWFLEEMDIIKESRVIKTHVVGWCCSMGIAILINGTKGYRSSTYNSNLMMHYTISGVPSGLTTKQESWVNNRKIIDRQFLEYYKTRTKLTEKQLKNSLADDWFFTAAEALQYGLIDEIVKHKEYHPRVIDKKKQMTYEKWEELKNGNY